MIFNHNEPDLPPDFIFDCHNFEPNFDNLEVSDSLGQAVCVIWVGGVAGYLSPTPPTQITQGACPRLD